MNLVSAWQNFYVIVGSSGGRWWGFSSSLMALIASMRRHADPESIGAFGMPTVAHFGAALTISAIMSAPWPSLLGASVMLAACGLGGLTYSAVVVRRAHRQRGYRPIAEDWLWYAVLPCGVYVALTSASVTVPSGREVTPRCRLNGICRAMSGGKSHSETRWLLIVPALPNPHPNGKALLGLPEALQRHLWVADHLDVQRAKSDADRVGRLPLP